MAALAGRGGTFVTGGDVLGGSDWVGFIADAGGLVDAGLADVSASEPPPAPKAHKIIRLKITTIPHRTKGVLLPTCLLSGSAAYPSL